MVVDKLDKIFLDCMVDYPLDICDAKINACVGDDTEMSEIAKMREFVFKEEGKSAAKRNRKQSDMN